MKQPVFLFYCLCKITLDVLGNMAVLLGFPYQLIELLFR